MTSFIVMTASINTTHLTVSGSEPSEIVYRIVDSPIGDLLIATTPAGLVRVAFACEGFDEVLGTLATEVSPRIHEDPAKLTPIATELAEYFNGTRRDFTMPLDFSLSTGPETFRRRVQQYLPQIAYGHTQSYRDIAEALANPKASRAVGTACATNPLPIVVPCHRVLRSDGRLGGFRGGLPAKTILLEHEHATSLA